MGSLSPRTSVGFIPQSVTEPLSSRSRREIIPLWVPKGGDVTPGFIVLAARGFQYLCLLINKTHPLSDGWNLNSRIVLSFLTMQDFSEK